MQTLERLDVLNLDLFMVVLRRFEVCVTGEVKNLFILADDSSSEYLKFIHILADVDQLFIHFVDP